MEYFEYFFWNIFVKIIFKNVHDRNNDQQLEKIYQFLKISVNYQLLLEVERPLHNQIHFFIGSSWSLLRSRGDTSD